MSIMLIVNSGVRVLDFNCFLNFNGVLSSELGVYNNPGDSIHLGKVGIRLLAKTFRDSILGRMTDGRSYSGVLSHNHESFPPPSDSW